MNENEAGKEFYIPPLPVFYTTFCLIPCLTLWTFLQCLIVFIIQWRCVKMCSPLLRLCPSVCSVSSASAGSLPFSYSFPLSQMKGCPCAAIHSSLFWMCGFLILCILNTYHHKCSIPSCSAGSFFPAWWVRALSGMVRFLELPPKAAGGLPHCSQ